MKYISCLLALALCSCSPFAKQIKELDKAYAAGTIKTETYLTLRSQALQGEMMFQQNLSRNLNAMNASLANVNNNITQQNAINAYNQRTYQLAQPQTVNVYHSGTVNQNVNGTLYLR